MPPEISNPNRTQFGDVIPAIDHFSQRHVPLISVRQFITQLTNIQCYPTVKPYIVITSTGKISKVSNQDMRRRNKRLIDDLSARLCCMPHVNSRFGRG